MVAKGVWHKVECGECSKVFDVADYTRKAGRGKFCSKSCGARFNGRIHGHSTHSSQSRTYSTWCTMRARCNNPNNPKYYLYGERGIKVCDEWRKFEGFLRDMGPRPKGKTLDRIDGEKGYYKSNCRWATPVQQSANTSQVIFYDYGGQKVTMRQLAEMAGVNKRTMHVRVKKWPRERWLEPKHN